MMRVSPKFVDFYIEGRLLLRDKKTDSLYRTCTLYSVRTKNIIYLTLKSSYILLLRFKRLLNGRRNICHHLNKKTCFTLESLKSIPLLNIISSEKPNYNL